MRIYITEDEPLAAAKLKLFIEKLGYGGDVTLFSNGEDLMFQLSAANDPDLLFLDINMPGMSGLEVMRAINGRFPVVLTTAYDQYALEGFNCGVTDYLLKPYTMDRLKQAIERVAIHKDTASEPKSEEPATSSLEVRADGRTEVISYDSIISLESQKDYTELTLTDGRRLRTLATLSSLIGQLPETTFKRVQRSWVVNTQKVQSYTSTYMIMTNGSRIPIGRKFKE